MNLRFRAASKRWVAADWFSGGTQLRCETEDVTLTRASVRTECSLSVSVQCEFSHG